MAYHDSVKVVEGDIVVVQASQASLEMSDSPRVFQFNNQEPHVVAKENLASGVGTASSQACAFSPDGKYLVWCIAQRVIIYNLETGNVSDTSLGVTTAYMFFTGDSTTALISTTSAPFLVAVDLYSGANKGTIGGTYTFTSSTAGSGYGSKCYIINRGTSMASSSIYEYDANTNNITTIHTSSVS